MTTTEEDLLLSEPGINDFDHLTDGIDEDLLLGAGDIHRNPTQESVDDSVLLDSIVPEQNEQENKNVNDELGEDVEEEEDVESEKEELDYDEEEDDDEKRERTSRFASEKKGGARVEMDEGDENKKEEENGANGKPKIPSLFDKTITNNPMKGGAIGVILRIEGEPEKVFYPPPGFMNAFQPQAIVPRLPNGIPLVVAPTGGNMANHGRAGFGSGYQAETRLAAGGGMPQWDQAVNMFLTKTTKSSSSRSRGSRKRRSSSYSSTSSYSSESSRSRSRSPSRRRDRKERRRDDRDRRRHHDDRKHRDSERDRSSRRRKEKNSAVESAKALGLSNDYLDKVNDQKRKREEIVRKKYGEKPASHAPTSSASASASTSSTSNSAAQKDKLKPYLAVNVAGVQQLPTAVKKIETLANELGPIKKCWRSSDDIVSIIFNTHDKAKEFMRNYNGKVLSGLRIAVSLDKKFLNLSEVN